MSYKNELFKSIKEKRNISDTSINIYITCLELTNLYINNTRIFEDLKFLKKKKIILNDFFKDKKLTFKKKYLSAFIAALDTKYDENEKLIEYYKKLLNKYNDILMENEINHIKSDKQVNNMVSNKYMNDIRKDLKTKIEENDDFYINQDYVISSIYTLIPPRRLDDYALMKIVSNNYYQNLKYLDKIKNNYLVKKDNKLHFIFCNYKTDKIYGIQKFEIKGNLKKIINKWLEINTSDNFLLNKDKKQMTSNLLGKMITNIFSNDEYKNVSLNQIRHSFITNNNVVNNPSIAFQMAHSIQTQNYYKKD